MSLVLASAALGAACSRAASSACTAAIASRRIDGSCFRASRTTSMISARCSGLNPAAMARSGDSSASIDTIAADRIPVDKMPVDKIPVDKIPAWNTRLISGSLS